MEVKEFVRLYGENYSKAVADNTGLFDVYFCPTSQSWHSHVHCAKCVDGQALKIELQTETPKPLTRAQQKRVLAVVFVLFVVSLLLLWWAV